MWAKFHHSPIPMEKQQETWIYFETVLKVGKLLLFQIYKLFEIFYPELYLQTLAFEFRFCKIKYNYSHKRTFRVQSYLEDHRRDHSNFQCETCKKTFQREDRFWAHVLKGHEKEFEECKECQVCVFYTFTLSLSQWNMVNSNSKLSETFRI